MFRTIPCGFVMTSFLMAFCLVTSCLMSVVVVGEEPKGRLIAVADSEIAEILSPMMDGDELVVLLPQAGQTQPMIDQRAWALRSAERYVFDSRRESLLEALYRERLQMQGVIAVDVQNHLPPHWQRREHRRDRRSDSLLVALNTLAK